MSEPTKTLQPVQESAGVETRTEAGDESRREESHRVARFATLDGFSEELRVRGGIDPRELEPLTRLRVKTVHSLYEITMLDPADSRMLIRGGMLFAEGAEAKLSGATFGASLLKMGWIGHGMRMELYIGGCTVVTSPVRSIEILEESFPAPS